MRGLSGKRVLVTGGTSGIGLAAARRFLEEGCSVFVCGADEPGLGEALGALSPLGSVAGRVCDVSDEAQVRHLLGEAEDAHGGIDVLINNAGIARTDPFLQIEPRDWDRTMAVNLRGMFLVAQAVAVSMVRRGAPGSIVNMASTNALGGEPDFAHYNASKAGVLMLTKTMAVELGRHGIRVNCVCPGFIDTPLNRSLLTEQESTAYEHDKIPLGRRGRAEEVAAAYAFLASDDASFVHGEALVVDGGQLAVM